MRNRLLRTSSSDSVIVHLYVLSVAGLACPTAPPYRIRQEDTHPRKERPTARTCRPLVARLEESVVQEDDPVDLHQDADQDRQRDEREIEHDVADPHRLEDLAKGPQGRVGDRVDEFGDDE